MGATLYGDDAQPMKAPGRGGPRPGSGRLPKPALSDAEFLAVLARRELGARKHGSSWQACAQIVSRMRGAEQAIDPRTIAGRKVSAPWVREAFNAKLTKMQNQPKTATEPALQNLSDGAGNGGPRIVQGPSLEETASESLQGPVKEAALPAVEQEVASGGSKA